VEPEKQLLLKNGSETLVSRQRSQKSSGTMSVAGQRILTKQQLNSNKGTVLSLLCMLRCYNWDGLEQRIQSSVEVRL
jgi:hypothetical protein